MYWSILFKIRSLNILCLILSDNVKYCQILSNVVRYQVLSNCQILLNIVRYYQILSDTLIHTVLYCQTWTKCYSSLSTVRHCLQIARFSLSLSDWSKTLNEAKTCHVLKEMVQHMEFRCLVFYNVKYCYKYCLILSHIV